MKWHIEDIGIHAHVMDGEEPIGLGFPVKLASNIVDKHNTAIDKTIKKVLEILEENKTYLNWIKNVSIEEIKKEFNLEV